MLESSPILAIEIVSPGNVDDYRYFDYILQKEKLVMQPLQYHIKMTRDQAEQLRDCFPLLILMWFGLLTLHWYKPSFYWNDDPIIKIFTTLLGQRITDILGYGGILWLLLGFILLRQEAERILS